MSVTVFAFTENDTLAKSVVSQIHADFGLVHVHRFPDQECCVRIKPDDVTDVCIVFASLCLVTGIFNFYISLIYLH